MDFTFDLSQTPVIGRKYLPKGSTGPNSLNSDILYLSSEKTGEKSNAGSGPNSVSGTISNTEESSLVIGQLANLDKNEKNLQENVLFESPRRSMSLSPADVVNISGWKRPWMSQVIFSCHYLHMRTIEIYVLKSDFICIFLRHVFANVS